MTEFSGTIGPQTFHRTLTRISARKRRRKSILANLMLTPMVDMFSLLVIFLLQVFSASPDTLIVPPGLILPQASTALEVKDAPLLTLTKTEVFLDRERLGTIDEVMSNPAPLAEKLEHMRKQWHQAHSDHETFPGEINVEAHKELPSTVVAKIMGVLPSQQFGSIQLVSLSEGSGK